MPTDPRQLAQEALERAEKATFGPWSWEIEMVNGEQYLWKLGPTRRCLTVTHRGAEPSNHECPDADFIAHAREDVPRLARMVIAREDVVESLRVFAKFDFSVLCAAYGEPAAHRGWSELRDEIENASGILARLAAEEER